MSQLHDRSKNVFVPQFSTCSSLKLHVSYFDTKNKYYACKQLTHIQCECDWVGV